MLYSKGKRIAHTKNANSIDEVFKEIQREREDSNQQTFLYHIINNILNNTHT